MKLTLETIQNFKPTQEQIRNCELVFLNMAKVDTIRPIVEKYQKKILEKHKFEAKRKDEREFLYKETFLKYISEPKHSYLMKDSDSKIYFKELEDAHLEHGFNVKKDYCPLLIAESDLIDAKRNFVNSMASLTNIKWKDVTKLEHYSQIVELNLKFMVKFIRSKEDILKELM